MNEELVLGRYIATNNRIEPECSYSTKMTSTSFSCSCQEQKPTRPSSAGSIKTNNTANTLSSRNNSSVKKTSTKPKPINCFKETQFKKTTPKKISSLKQKKETKDKTQVETSSYGTSENICESSYIDSETLLNDNGCLENNRIDSKIEFDKHVKDWLTNLESMLTNVKETQENKNCTILNTLSKLENKMEENESHIKNLKCNFEKLISNVSVEKSNMPNQSNTKEVNDDCHQKQTTNINDKRNNLEHKTQSIVNENTSNRKQCVCNLLGSVSNNNHHTDISYNNTKKVNTDTIPKCQSIKKKDESIMFQEPVLLPKPILLAEPISCLKLMPLQDSSSDSELASLQEHAIEHAKKLNVPCETKNIQLKVKNVSTSFNKNNNSCITMSSEESKHDFNNISKLPKSDCAGGICEFLRSQPIPEWIKKMKCLEKSVSSKPCQLCCCKKNSAEIQNDPAMNKLLVYNIERIVHNNNYCSNDTVYQITSKDQIKRMN